MKTFMFLNYLFNPFLSQSLNRSFTQFPHRFVRWTVASTIALASPLAVMESAFTHPDTGVLFLANAFNPPNEGEPVQTVGGASRGTCETGSLSNVLFFKKQNALSQSYLEAQIPSGMAHQVFFSLRNRNNETVYQGFLPVDTIQNRVLVDYHTLAEVQENQTYQWSMAIICGKALRPDSPVFQGTL